MSPSGTARQIEGIPAQITRAIHAGITRSTVCLIIRGQDPIRTASYQYKTRLTQYHAMPANGCGLCDYAFQQFMDMVIFEV